METAKRKRGFAAMDPALVRELAKKGGKAAHAVGGAHKFTKEEARAAGRKGGLTTAKRRDSARSEGTSEVRNINEGEKREQA